MSKALTMKMAETDMREMEVPTPRTIEELDNFISTLVNMNHDYGTCVYAMSMAATAAFNYVASQLRVTGFQASCADMDFIRRTRRLDCPAMLVTADKMLFPQYDLREQMNEALKAWAPWAAEQARKRLSEPIEHAHPDVIAHWKALADTQCECPDLSTTVTVRDATEFF